MQGVGQSLLSARQVAAIWRLALHACAILERVTRPVTYSCTMYMTVLRAIGQTRHRADPCPCVFYHTKLAICF